MGIPGSKLGRISVHQPSKSNHQRQTLRRLFHCNDCSGVVRVDRPEDNTIFYLWALWGELRVVRAYYSYISIIPTGQEY
jgi:hypothetical protein